MKTAEEMDYPEYREILSRYQKLKMLSITQVDLICAAMHQLKHIVMEEYANQPAVGEKYNCVHCKDTGELFSIDVESMMPCWKCPKPKQPAVSEDKLSEIFANHADNTPYLNFTAFKEAVKELLNR